MLALRDRLLLRMDDRIPLPTIASRFHQLDHELPAPVSSWPDYSGAAWYWSELLIFFPSIIWRLA